MKKAFSLIESLIAISVLVIAIVTIAQVIALGLRLEKISLQKTQSIYQDQTNMENTISQPYEQIQGEEILPGLKKIEIGKLFTYIAKQ